MTILHAALASDWEAATASTARTYTGSTRGRSIADEGFMHCCHDEEQLRGVLDRYYADVTDPMVVLVIDVELLERHGLRVVCEPGNPAAGSGSQTFPHVYGGDLPVEAVVGVRPLRPSSS